MLRKFSKENLNVFEKFMLVEDLFVLRTKNTEI